MFDAPPFQCMGLTVTSLTIVTKIALFLNNITIGKILKFVLKGVIQLPLSQSIS